MFLLILLFVLEHCKYLLFRGTVVTKAPLRVQFLPALGGRGLERGKAEASSLALLSKKGVGREGPIESQQKFDFFCSDIMPNPRLQDGLTLQMITKSV